MPTRNYWHLGFARLVSQRAPSGFEVRAEVQLSTEPQRADLILIRRLELPQHDEEAQVLRYLWPQLAKETVLEYKSPTRDFRRTDLMKLASYGAQYHVLAEARVYVPSELSLVLVVPSLNAAFEEEVARMGWTFTRTGGGYGRIAGGVYTVIVAITDDVSDEEHDDYLRIFSHHPVETPEAGWWWREWGAEDGSMTKREAYEGYEEMAQKIANSLPLKQRLGGLSPEQVLREFAPEQRLGGLSPEQRLAGLTREQQLLACPDEILRSLSEEYLRSFPPEVQDAVRKRIGRPGV